MPHNLSRRDLLAASASTLATAAIPNIWIKNPLFSQENLIIGEGEFKFECIHDWLMGPGLTNFGDTHGVTQDKNGNIYVAHTVGQDSPWPAGVCVYNESGEFIRRWGQEFAGGSHGLDIREENGKEFLFHCDTRRQLVVKTDLAGHVIWQFSVPQESGVYKEGKRFVPTNVAFLPNSNLIIGDGYGSSYLHEITKDGEYIRTIGTPGNGKGQLSQPHGLWLDDRGSEPVLVVADRGNNRLQYFDLDGQHIKFVTENMKQPCHFDIQNGHMLIPHLSAVVSILDENNKMVAWLGQGGPDSLRGKPRNEFPNGKFIHPHDAMFLRNGDILIAEWVPQGRITLLKKIRN